MNLTTEIRLAVPAKPRSAFLDKCARVPIDHLIQLKVLRPAVKSSQKYQQIVASVRAVGLIEPPAVTVAPDQPGYYFVLDGHLRIEALKDIGVSEVDCLVATDDDTYTYNKRINRLSAVQDHRMIVRAMERGVSAERLGEALGLSPQTVRHHFRMLDGICDEAAERMADKPCPAKIFDVLRKMKPMRQIEATELMIGQKNYTVAFVNAMLVATPPNQLVAQKRDAGADAVSADSMARMERELAVLQAKNRVTEDTYGPDVLHLTVIKGYVGGLLGRAPIVRWLAKHQPEYLREFQNLTELSGLPSLTENSASLPN